MSWRDFTWEKIEHHLETLEGFERKISYLDEVLIELENIPLNDMPISPSNEYGDWWDMTNRCHASRRKFKALSSLEQDSTATGSQVNNAQAALAVWALLRTFGVQRGKFNKTQVATIIHLLTGGSIEKLKDKLREAEDDTLRDEDYQYVADLFEKMGMKQLGDRVRNRFSE